MDGAHWACAGCSVCDSPATIGCWETNNRRDGKAGMPMADLVAAWEKPFLSESEGG